MLLKGFDQEYLPHEQLQFNALVEAIRRSFELFGFMPIETPSAERKEILTSKGGVEKEIYALCRLAAGPEDGDAIKGALHFDLTVPLARYVAMHEHALAFPFRRYQIQRVWRGENPQANKGRFREFYQCDIDIINKGSLSYLAEAEIPSVIYRVFSEMEIGEFRIRINNRKVLKGLLRHFDVPDEKSADVLRILDKADREPAEAILADLERQGLKQAVARGIFQLLTTKNTSDETIRALSEFNAHNELLDVGVSELKKIVAGIRQFGVPDSAFTVDLGVVRGLDYYTGTIYETTLLSHPDLGSICSGGRYDDLASYFTNTKLPGVGISIGLTRLFSKLREAALLKEPKSTPAEVLVATMDPKYLDRYLEIATQLRSAGVNTEVFLENAKIGKQLEYANKKGFRLALIAGEDEIHRDEVQIKNMATQSQSVCSLSNLTSAVREALKGV
jgi:histidyl-tRNA synthetase